MWQLIRASDSAIMQCIEAMTPGIEVLKRMKPSYMTQSRSLEGHDVHVTVSVANLNCFVTRTTPVLDPG